jgi:hypothetical protein
VNHLARVDDTALIEEFIQAFRRHGWRVRMIACSPGSSLRGITFQTGPCGKQSGLVVADQRHG